VKLLLDEQISGKIAARLRKQGVDAIAVAADPALRGLRDPDVFEFAQQQNRTVVTYDRMDFEVVLRNFAATGREHHGLVIVHPARFPNSDFARLVRSLTKLTLPPGGSFVVWLQER
jgi:predicted nuclease of predicted toxin-antitoxin system